MNNLVIACMDYRVQKGLKKFLLSLGIDDYYLISNEGSVKWINILDENMIIEGIKKAVAGGVKNILLCNHINGCKGYSHDDKFIDKCDTEKKSHFSELTRAKEKIENKFKDVIVNTALIGIGEDGNLFKVK